MRDHIFSSARDVCLACNKTRESLEDGEPEDLECQGIIKYREYLVGSAWVKVPIVEDFMLRR